MKIQIYNKLKNNKQKVIDHVQRRLHFSISRFEKYIESVRVRLFDINGPRGGTDQHCSILVRLGFGKKIFIESTGSTWVEAVDLVADRTGRAVSRAFQARRALRFQSGMVPREWGMKS